LLPICPEAFIDEFLPNFARL